MKTLTLSKFPTKMIVTAFAVGAFIFSAILANADTMPVITVSVHDGSHAVLTSAPIGTAVHGNVALASTTGPTVTGTVDFWLYSGTTCTGTASVQTGIALAGGSAESATTTVGVGGLSYKVHYNGLTDVYPAIDSACQPLNATSVTTTLTTTLSTTTALAGTSVSSSAVLGGATANATGTVTYNVYLDNACSITSSSAGIKTVTNAIVPNSDSVQFNSIGAFYWKAFYSGDQNNLLASSTCSSLSILATSTPPVTGAGSISGIVYNDANKNQSRDSGEVGIGGFTVNLYKGAGWWGPRHRNMPIRNVVTDANGNYAFTGLADGTYSIEEIRKPGWKQITSDFRKVDIVNGAQIIGKDFGNSSTTPKEHKKDKDDDKDHKNNGKKDKDDNENKANKGAKGLENRFKKFQEFLRRFEIWKSSQND